MKRTEWLRNPRIWSLAAAVAIPLVFMAPMIVFCPSGATCRFSLNRIGGTDEGGGVPEQILGAAVMAACGFFAEHIGGGHLSFTPFLYLPAILWAFRRALAAPPADFRHAVLAAALLAATVLEGGTYPAPL